MLDILKQIARVGIVAGRRQAEAAPGDAAADPELRAVGRAPCMRHVDAGSCNGCELEIHALGNVYYNIEASGMKFVASPRHADLLLVSGPVSRHMREALLRTHDATPAPKRVVAVGDCAIDGGIFDAGYASCGGVADVIAVDATASGCPPAPEAIIAAIERALES
ncbi:MAG: NAD(P)H-quinone oxidoreductase subunit K, chloroplastic [Pseudomonadales bacterium]|nr:NAD(P)H-quinone oxidoreductase subunit K, chloroplastic [Pseudomonadales bacterium]